MRTRYKALLTSIALVATLGLPFARAADAATGTPYSEAQDPCTAIVPSTLPLVDGPFSSTTEVSGDGYAIRLSAYPGHTTIDQFTFTRPNGAPIVEGLAYVYQHGTTQHVCGGGQAVANRRSAQSAPSSVRFYLDAVIGPAGATVHIQLDNFRYYIIGYPEKTPSMPPARPAQPGTRDDCTLAVPPSLRPTDGPFYTGLQFAAAGYKLWLATYPVKVAATPLGAGTVRATIDQFAFTQPGVPAYEGLVYVYRHGTTQHVCGVGQAVANRQSRPSYAVFHIDATITPQHIAATVQVGDSSYHITGPIQHWRSSR